MPMANEEDYTSRPIVVSREPVGPKNAASKGSVGDQAVMDAVLIIAASWLFLFFLSFSLRGHNV